MKSMHLLHAYGPSRKLILGAAIGTFGLSLATGLPTAQARQADLDCGATVNPGESIKLRGDVGPCFGLEPAITVVGPATLNLNGRTVACGPAAGIAGIVVLGARARIQNGTIQDCSTGVEVAGDGNHKLLKLTAKNNSDGFRIIADHNKLVKNMATANSDRGFKIDGGSYNDLVNNRAQDNPGEGFRVEDGDRNRLVNNEAINNDDHGFRLDDDDDPPNDNQLINNRSEGNLSEGFRVEGQKNRLHNNRSFDNGDEGFRIRRAGSNNELTNNRAVGNGFTDDEAGYRVQGSENALRNNRSSENCGHGFEIDGNSNEVIHNRASMNGDNRNACDPIELGDGIRVTGGAIGNTIMRNTALNNFGIDMTDGNPNCDENEWSRNIFNTSRSVDEFGTEVPMPACIQ